MRYIKIIPFFCVAFLLVFCFGCKNNNEKSISGKGQITVSIEPLRFIAEEIAGDYFEVTTLVPKGSSPETYEPTPKQMMALNKSCVYFSVGQLGFERSWLEKLQAAAPDVKFVNTGDNIIKNQTRGYTKKVSDCCGHDGCSDPHIWTTPHNMKMMAEIVCSTLCCVDSIHADDFRTNLKALNDRLDACDAYIVSCVKELSQKTFLIYHPTLTYFAQDYGLQQLAVEQEGKEPTTKQLAQIIRTCREKKVRVVFIQQEFDRKNAELIAKEIGARLVTINPLSFDWEEQMHIIADELSKTSGNE